MRPPFWGLADGPMVSHWLGGRLWGLAIGFPHWSFAQESLQSYLDCLLFCPNHTTPVLCKLFIYFKLSSHCEDSEPKLMHPQSALWFTHPQPCLVYHPLFIWGYHHLLGLHTHYPDSGLRTQYLFRNMHYLFLSSLRILGFLI
jgi:hypothetical protein